MQKYSQDQFKQLVKELFEFQDRMSEKEGKIQVDPMPLEEWTRELIGFADLKRRVVGDQK